MSIDPEDTGAWPEDVGRRLGRSRRALGLDQEEFAGGAGLTQPRYNPYETGKRPLTLNAAMLLCERYQLTLDWLFRGDPSGLPYRLHDRIKQIAQDERASAKPHRKSKPDKAKTQAP